MKKIYAAVLMMLLIVCLTLLYSCDGIVNTVGDKHFEEDGTIKLDSNEGVAFVPTAPTQIKFYVEVSGSMNGFFRANKVTYFKQDVWQIFSFFSNIAPEIRILTNDGNKGNSYPQAQFQTIMNTGGFVSTASTRVPDMIRSIFKDLNTDEGEVAVLVSDMKYDPVGAAAPDVLLSQYSTDISKILGVQGKAVCLIGAISDYLDKSGNVVANKSPYYYLVIGDGPQVAYMRNGISTMLENNERFIDNIESGFNYGVPTCSFGIPENCLQLGNNPTFVDFDETSNDTCTINMKVHLENYRWLLASESYFAKAFKIKTLYGSNVKVGKISFDITNITAKQLLRTATAIVEVKVFDMAQDSEVLEWTLELPDTDFSAFAPYFENANNPDDVTKSYSVQDFVKGIFYGGIVNKTLKPNYILISKNS